METSTAPIRMLDLGERRQPYQDAQDLLIGYLQRSKLEAPRAEEAEFETRTVSDLGGMIGAGMWHQTARQGSLLYSSVIKGVNTVVAGVLADSYRMLTETAAMPPGLARAFLPTIHVGREIGQAVTEIASISAKTISIRAVRGGAVICASRGDTPATTAMTRSEYPVADFYKPLQLTWSEADFEVEKALKAFTEGNHADRSATE
jgi:hypothetical protein